MKDRRIKKNAVAMILIAALCLTITGCSNKAKAYYNNATKEYKNGNYEVAKEYYEKVVKQKGERAEYYIDYGYCLIKLGSYDEAIQMFQSVIYEKENSIIRKNNKKAYRGIGIAYYAKKDYKMAYENFERAKKIASLNELDLDILSYMGCMKEHLGEYEEALKLYDEVVKEEPKNIDVLQNRANVYYQLGKLDQSMEDYKTAMKIDSSNYNLYFGSYALLKDQGKKEEADEMLTRVLEIKGETSEDKFNKAKARFYQGEVKDAVSDFEVAAEEGYFEAYSFLGDIGMEAKDYTLAAYYYEQLEDKTGSLDSSTYEKYGFCELQMNDDAKALKLFQKGIACAGTKQLQGLLKNEIISYENLGMFQDAVVKMKEYLSLYPEDKDAKRDYKYLLTRTDEVKTNGNETSKDTSETEKNGK